MRAYYQITLFMKFGYFTGFGISVYHPKRYKFNNMVLYTWCYMPGVKCNINFLQYWKGPQLFLSRAWTQWETPVFVYIIYLDVCVAFLSLYLDALPFSLFSLLANMTPASGLGFVKTCTLPELNTFEGQDTCTTKRWLVI